MLELEWALFSRGVWGVFYVALWNIVPLMFPEPMLDSNLFLVSLGKETLSAGFDYLLCLSLSLFIRSCDGRKVTGAAATAGLFGGSLWELRCWSFCLFTIHFLFLPLCLCGWYEDDSLTGRSLPIEKALYTPLHHFRWLLSYEKHIINRCNSFFPAYCSAKPRV